MNTTINHKLTQLHTRGDERNPPRPLTEAELQRRVNMIMLIDDSGGQTPMAKKLGTANTSYLSQQISTTPHRVINEKSARKLEGILGLQPGWMDRPQTRIVYATKGKLVVTELLHHEHIVREEPISYGIENNPVVDSQRLEECLEKVLTASKDLSTNKIAKIVSAIYKSKLNGDQLIALATTLINFSAN